jgi:DNA polymerase-3 subunit epsilon
MEKRNKAIEWAKQTNGERPASKIVHPDEVAQWARHMCDVGAVALDTEATGGAFQDEIFEIAIVRVYDGKVLFNQLFKPLRPVSWHSTKVHNFTTKDLKDYPKFVDYWDEIRNLLIGVPVLAFNSSFDKRLIEQTCARYELQYPELIWDCVMKRYGQFVRRRTGLSLSKVCEELGITGGTHRAKEDALAAARIVWSMSRD